MSRARARSVTFRGVRITLSTDGKYHAKATVGHKPNGELDRRHRSGDTPEEVKEKLRKLLDEVVQGRAPKAGKAPTVQEWMEHWLTVLAPHGRRKLAPTTIAGYQSKCRNWIFPHLGRLRLDVLEPENLDAMYEAMREAGKAEAHILQVHAIVRRALGIAMQRGKIMRNVATMVESPATARPKRTPLDDSTALAIVERARVRRNAARWLVGLSIGSRQGEVLGLTWPHVDLDAGTVEIAWQLQRLPWRHGCTDPHACGTKHHRFAACRVARRGKRAGGCSLHPGKKGCPPPCAKNCTRHAAWCPARRDGGLVLRRPKTWREDNPEPHVVGLPSQVVDSLRQLRKTQAEEKLAAGNKWRTFPHPEGGVADFVFRQIDGAPLDPRQDWGELQDILTEAGVKGARVHALRHTAATMLIDLGVPIEVIQDILGHAQIQTTRGYATVRTAVTKSATKKIGDKLFGTPVTDLVTERERRRRSAG